MITAEQALSTPWYSGEIEKLGGRVYAYWVRISMRHGSFTNVWNNVVADASLGDKHAKQIVEFAEREYYKWRLTR